MADDSSSDSLSTSPSTSVSPTDSQLSDVCAADGSAATSSSAVVAAAASIASTSSASTFDSSTPSRKRKRSAENWQKSKRKLLRNSGKEYVTASKKNVEARKCDHQSCGCALKCYDKVPHAQREALFTGFWSSSDFNTQNAYLCGCIKVVAIKRRYTAADAASRRTQSRVYYVQCASGMSVRVCRKAFLRIHAISGGRVDRALKSFVEAGGSPQMDKRGRHEPGNKTPEESISYVEQHIASFPQYESHYSRSDNPNRKYLSPDLTVSKMYNMYKAKCADDGKEPVSDWLYRKTFNENFNLSFGRPRTDTCKVCDEMKVKVDAETNVVTKQQLSGEWELHKRKAERAYQQLKEDTALSKSTSDVDTITFDLQQSLPTPILTTNIVFYKRQLWTYNLGIHDCKTSKAYMHTWHEGTASRGSQEIASCLRRHLKTNESIAKHLIAFSDACGGQNRNINMVCMWLYIVASDDYPYTVVDHKFMVSGHSYLPNDRDFGGVESARRRQPQIFIPEDWCTLVEKARRKNPFTVVRMSGSDFVSVNRLTENITNRKTDADRNKVEWLKMRWVRVEKDKPYQFSYRYTHNTLENWKVVDIKKRKAGRPVDLGALTLEDLYSGPRAINNKKAEDLQQLLSFIPPIQHSFYTSLLATVTEAEQDD